MDENDSKILTDIEEVLKRKNDANIDTLVLYSLLSNNMSDVDNIMKISDEHTLEIKAKDLKEFMLNFKISNNILSQMIKNNIDQSTFEEIKTKYNLEINFENIAETRTPPLRSLIGYNNLLKERDYLIDDQLINFLSYLEKGQADNASLTFEELSIIQKESVPVELQDWINKNSLYC